MLKLPPIHPDSGNGRRLSGSYSPSATERSNGGDGKILSTGYSYSSDNRAKEEGLPKLLDRGNLSTKTDRTSSIASIDTVTEGFQYWTYSNGSELHNGASMTNNLYPDNRNSSIESPSCDDVPSNPSAKVIRLLAPLHISPCSCARQPSMSPSSIPLRNIRSLDLYDSRPRSPADNEEVSSLNLRKKALTPLSILRSVHAASPSPTSNKGLSPKTNAFNWCSSFRSDTESIMSEQEVEHTIKQAIAASLEESPYEERSDMGIALSHDSDFTSQSSHDSRDDSKEFF